MLILSCASKLQLLETLLKRNLPQTVVVYGAVKNINRGNPVGHEVIVDSWPDFKAVLTRPKSEAITDNADMYKNIYAAFYWDLDVYRKLLLDTDAVNWKQTFRLYGNQNGIYEVSKDAAATKKIHLTAIPHFTYLQSNPDKMPQRQLDPGFRISTLKSSHIDILNETWRHGGNEQSRQFLDNMVKCFPNICILDSNDNPISWILLDPLGAQIHGYTLQSHRRKGHLITVMRALSIQSYAAGHPVYGLQDGLYETARDIAESRRVNLKPYFYQTALHPDPSAYCQSRYRSDLFHIGSLNSSHSALLNENWSVGRNDWSLRYLDSLIHNFPSACLLDKDGQLVAWCLSDSMGCLTHGYTFPQYRGQGCVAAVTRATAVKLHACGFPLYGGVLADNQPSKQALERQGFHILPLTKYALYFTPSLQPTG